MLMGGYSTQDKYAGPNGGAYSKDDEVCNAKDPLQAVPEDLTLTQELWNGLLSEES